MRATPAGPNGVRDEVVALHADRSVVAILSRAADGARDRPAAILLNAGVLHRVGPHRLHVELGRRLAARGIPTLRVDLAGVGDSPPRSTEPTFRASAVVDVRAAMTELTALTGRDQFILFGLCSGADNAIAAALADRRVAAVVLLDPPTYATRRARLRQVAARARGFDDAGAALAWAGALAARRLRRLTAAPPAADPSDGGQRREIPSAAAHGADLTALVERGVHVLAIYSGVHRERYNHADQVFEMFAGLRGRIERAYFPDANHSFTALAARAAMTDTVVAWVARHFH
ncbi:MAG: alpha/beta fold hydrolase [Kofleriaceae bacterium]